MRRSTVVRALTLALAFIHTFPARKHLVAFVSSPSWEQAWEGFGALVAIAIYLLPVGVQSRGLAFLWRRRRGLLRAVAMVLAAAHLVPALDHVPAFVSAPNWADAWRGLGSTLAVAWFLAPLPLQARVISLLGRAARLPPSHLPSSHLPSSLPSLRPTPSLRTAARQP
jgi:hypothetical protein